MLEQFKYSKGSVFFLAIVFSISVFFQISCAQANKPSSATVASPAPTVQTVDKTQQNNTPAEGNKPNGKLSQDELTDINKLVGRFKSATKEDRESALSVLEEAKKEFKNGKYTVSGQGFLESVSVFPTTEGLIKAAESIALMDISDQPKKERAKYKLQGFKESLTFFEIAKNFAEKTSNEKELEKYPDLTANIDCLKTYLANTKSKISCKLVQDALVASKIE
ncbi:MAG: hypothetical protein WBD27_18485 [Pyrinomonadaceae bacterium]